MKIFKILTAGIITYLIRISTSNCQQLDNGIRMLSDTSDLYYNYFTNKELNDYTQEERGFLSNPKTSMKFEIQKSAKQKIRNINKKSAKNNICMSEIRTHLPKGIFGRNCIVNRDILADYLKRNPQYNKKDRVRVYLLEMQKFCNEVSPYKPERDFLYVFHDLDKIISEFYINQRLGISFIYNTRFIHLYENFNKALCFKKEFDCFDDFQSYCDIFIYTFVSLNGYYQCLDRNEYYENENSHLDLCCNQNSDFETGYYRDILQYYPSYDFFQERYGICGNLSINFFIDSNNLSKSKQRELSHYFDYLVI